VKVVLFCGGLGLRLRGYSDDVPKPMVPIGLRPILWHLMKYYAHHGHKDFILCLGHRADTIKRFFLEYDEWLTNDFVMSGADGRPHLMGSDIGDWRITFVDTGIDASIGERLRSVRRYLDDDELFLANYSDNLTDAPLDDQIAYLAERPALVASFMSVVPALSLHSVRADEDGVVQRIEPISMSSAWAPTQRRRRGRPTAPSESGITTDPSRATAPTEPRRACAVRRGHANP
jgi:glucose-1-phosphate cytidylyltransferase